jgi:choline-sulfatase
MKSALLILLSAPLLFSLVCCGEPVRQVQTPERVILVTIDTTRADHMGFQGYPFATTPFLDSLAERSVVFKNAFAGIHVTVPSHLSIFTGLYPLVHGVQDNHIVYNSDFPTMAKYYENKGYKTAGFTGIKLFGPDNNNAGFDVLVSGIKNGRERGTMVVKAAEKWIKNNIAPEDSFFIWVHLFDPHESYTPDDIYYDQLKPSSPQEIKDYSSYLRDVQKISIDTIKMPHYGKGATPKYAKFRKLEERYQVIAAYDAEILAADQAVKQLYSAISDAGINDNALWIVTADHGEGLNTRMDLTGHGYGPNQELINVPLLFHLTDSPELNHSVDTPVRHVDIFPTLVDMAGDNIATELPIRNGFSLLNVIEDPEDDKSLKNRPVLSQRRFGKMNKYKDDNKRPLNMRPTNSLKQFTTEVYNYMENGYSFHYFASAENKLYNMESDPYQKNNIINDHPEIAKTMLSRVVRMVDALKKYAQDGDVQEDEAILQELRDLGYIQ